MKRNIYKFIFLMLSASSMFGSLVTQAADTVPMPSSGTCSFLINLPVPYGLDPSLLPYKTGGSFMGKITFSSASTGTLVGAVVNPTYEDNKNPSIYAKDNRYINDGVVTFTTMTQSNGFEGGILMKVSATYKDDLSGLPSFHSLFEANISPVNGGKTIFMQITNTNYESNGGPGPGTGVCQF